MNFQATLSSHRTLHLQNDGEQTSIALSSEGQNQSNSFTTGKWSQKPQLFEIGDGFVVQLHGDDETFVSIDKNGVHHLDKKPDLADAKPLEMQESEAKVEPEMKPLEPMTPMAPMKPM